MVLIFVMLGCVGMSDTDTGMLGDSGSSRPTDPSGESPYLEPIWVGFEYIGGWDEHNDALAPWTFNGLSYEPYVRLTFVEEGYFTTSSDDPLRQSTFCEVLATLEGGADALEARRHEDDVSMALRGSYVGTLSVFGYGDGDCENLDPERWPGGEARWAVDGLSLGLGFAEQTDFLASAWTESILEVYGDYMLSAWFAYNRPNDDDVVEFVAHDSTTALLWQWDAQTGELLVNADNQPIGQSTADPVLSGWISSYAYYFDTISNVLDLGVNDTP